MFWGSIQEIADFCGITRRSTTSVLNGKTIATKKGFRRMSSQEAIDHYQPPRPPKNKPIFHRKDYASKIHWKITFLKDWDKGEPYPKDSSRMFSGTPQEFTRYLNCNKGLIYRLINTYEGLPENNKLRSIQGWKIARVRRYTVKPTRQPRIKKDV